jgi:hypothetical protein
LVTMERNNTGVMSVSMEILRLASNDKSCIVTTAFGQTRHSIRRDLLSRLLGMVQLYPEYDCEEVYNCCRMYPGYDCKQLLPSSNTSQYIYIRVVNAVKLCLGYESRLRTTQTLEYLRLVHPDNSANQNPVTGYWPQDRHSIAVRGKNTFRWLGADR